MACMPRKECCENCRFWDEIKNFAENEIAGFCRRYPPTDECPKTGYSFHAITMPHIWCGEHQPKQSPRQ